jgi:N6-L-threonylcarbamoyladenine synthase
MLIENAVRAAQEYGEGTIVIAGGVAANTALREGMEKAAKKHGITVLLPPKYLCTDNAAMIGEAAFCAIKEGIPAASMDLDANPNL